ncbi:ribosome maturation factor RimM [Ramlibacter algicola]|uniref:Ribosome maturation factor RimM n=1 Tax=Ramlibacter algicola TaxID=2795217 RepID=A0A934PZP8_9BURK|nr:ribosome maturation factor RimM [Ramlibacter algicola]MBK0392505.1 ribosome maturation factor RimM [Ramlibacter algicola]
MVPGLEPAELPADAIEVGRIHDAWGIKGWFKVLPHSASPEALFSSRRWFLLPPEKATKPAFTGAQLLRIREAKEHSDSVVALAHDVDDRNAAELLKGARVFVPRSSFPTPADDEFYWVDLLGAQVVNREGFVFGTVEDLMPTGPQTVLVIARQVDGQRAETLIPFVNAFVDTVDIAGKRITVDWQPGD